MEQVKRQLYPVDEAVTALGISRSTIYILVKNGELELVKIGVRSLISAKSIDAYVEKLTAGVGNGCA